MTGDLFEEILASLEKENAMSQTTRDTLILRGIISLYTEIESLKKETAQFNKIIPLYKVMVGFGSIVMTLIVSLLWGILTNQVTISF